MDVEAGQTVGAGLGEVPAVEQVEHAQIEEERIVGLAGEHAADVPSRLPEFVDAAAVAAVVRRRTPAPTLSYIVRIGPAVNTVLPFSTRVTV